MESISNITALSERFAIPGKVQIVAANGGLTAIQITTGAAKAEIYLHGAHLTSFEPAGASQLIFVSSQTHWNATRAIRGGIPVCFPWFGAKADDANAPQHGFARTTEWSLAAVEEQGEAVQINLTLDSSEATLALWPHSFHAEYRVTADVALHLELTVTNTGNAPFRFEEALHTYHRVGSVEKASVNGLNGVAYLDKINGFRQKPQSGSITFTGPTDRVYLATTSALDIADAALGRHVTIEKSNSNNTVVWNPWIEGAASMSDMADDEWKQFVCVEAANCRDAAIELAPSASHTVTVTTRLV